MGTWLWCMGMFGACIAVFLRERRVLPSPLYATRNLSLLRYPRPRHVGVSPRCSLGWYGLVRKFHKMETVQTGTADCLWCLGMFGARFAVFL
jgi:hypothetical protein